MAIALVSNKQPTSPSSICLEEIAANTVLLFWREPAKAFDSVNRSILPGTQSVRGEGLFSKGIPQGSLLGPIILSFSINDIPPTTTIANSLFLLLYLLLLAIFPHTIVSLDFRQVLQTFEINFPVYGYH